MTPTLLALLEKVEELDKAATRGPWGPWKPGGAIYNIEGPDAQQIALAQACAPIGQPDPKRLANTEFISESRTLLPAMAKALKTLAEPHVPYYDNEAQRYCSACNEDVGESICTVLLEIESILSEARQ